MTGPSAGPESRREFRRARSVLVGGVDSPVRSFQAVGGTPVFFRRAQGPYLYDVDGRRVLDLVNSWGAVLLGHAPRRVVEAVRRASGRGLTFGAPSPLETDLAHEIQRAAPSLERLRFVSSGTEATMSAIRVARGFTRRTKIVKFSGGYHGHSDGLLASAGSGAATLALPESAGVPRSGVRDTIVASYNDREGVRQLFERVGAEVAAVIVEPVAGNMGVVPPVPGFLRELGALCRRHGALLIADEVITGFRLRRGTIVERLGGRADIFALGKVIGGGLPIGAYGGRREVLETVAPLGPVYQAGTLSGNPVAMAAGLATLRALTPDRYRHLEERSRELHRRLEEWAEGEHAGPFWINRIGSMFGLFFCEGPVVDRATAGRSDRHRYSRFFHAALAKGVYLPPSPLETTFTSMAIRSRDVRGAEVAFRSAFRASRPTGAR